VPLTLGRLAALPSLRLEALAGAAALDRPIRWAHVSELVDPTPFLEGGELLLTVGLWLDGGDSAAGDSADAAVDAYVRRLAAVGVVGLGFGVAPPHDEVPRRLVEAARRHDFPLLAVPQNVPFIAVSKAVSTLLAAERYDEVVRGYEQQRRLTRAAVAGDGARTVVRELAQEFDGWALLLDAAGEARAAHPDSAAARRSALATHVARLGTATTATSVSLADATEHVLLLPLATGRRVRGYLAVGTPHRLSAGRRQLVHTAASLLTLVLEQATSVRRTENRFRAAVFRLLAHSDLDGAAAMATDLWGGLPRDPVRVVAVAGGGEARAKLAEIAEVSAAESERVLVADVADRLVVVTSADGRAGDRLREVLRSMPDVVAGESQPVALAEVGRGHREAEQALGVGLRLGRRFTAFSDVGGEGLLRLLGGPDGLAFAESALRPLREHDAGGRGDLVGSLRVWLEHNGHWDGAAAALGVHRHTLRHRMRRVEELLARDLGAPGVRAELWTAVQLLDVGGGPA
jgi:purine catabolism regulator